MSNTLVIALAAWALSILGIIALGLVAWLLRALFGDSLGTALFFGTAIVAGLIAGIERITTK